MAAKRAGETVEATAAMAVAAVVVATARDRRDKRWDLRGRQARRAVTGTAELQTVGAGTVEGHTCRLAVPTKMHGQAKLTV